MRSRYNGREYVFNVHPHRIVSIIPQLNLETGKENGIHMFSNGSRIYYRETSMPNGTQITIESKKHHKQLYIEAVKSQLLYFDNVVFRIRNSGGQLTQVPIKAKILYEDEHVLLSDNTQYSKPHLLISRVNYGYVNWQELELEDVQGNIAFKVPSEEVTVKPSRESVVWNDLTRNTVIGYFHKVKTAAAELISAQLKVTDFIEWLEACSQINTRFGVDSVIGRMSQLVNVKDLEVKYGPDPTILYGFGMFDGLKVRVNTLEEKRAGTLTKLEIKREEKGVITAIADGLPLLVQCGNTSFRTDLYLLKGEYPNGFITLIDPFLDLDGDGAMHESLHMPVNYLPELVDVAKRRKTTTDSIADYLCRLCGYIRKSKHVDYYDDIVVPDDFDSRSEIEDAKTVEQVEAKKERERLQREKGVIPIFTPRNIDSAYIPTPNAAGDDHRLYEWQKLEMPVADIDQWSEEEVFYSNEKDSGLLHLAAMITRPKESLAWQPDLDPQRHKTFAEQSDEYQVFMAKYHNGPLNLRIPVTISSANPSYAANTSEVSKCHNFFETAGDRPRVKLIKVAQDRTKFFLDFKPIQRFFLDIKNKTLTMSNALVRWNTARLIHEKINQLRFLQNFERFNGKYCLWYRGLVNYVTTNYRELAEHSRSNRIFSLKAQTYDDLIDHMDRVTRFQLFVRENPGESEKIAQLAQDMFNPQQEITDGLAIDMEFYDRLNELLDFAQPISTLLNEIQILTNAVNMSITEELELEIRGYCESKGVKL